MTMLSIGSVPDRTEQDDVQDDLESRRQTRTIVLFVLGLVLVVGAFGLYALRAGV